MILGLSGQSPQVKNFSQASVTAINVEKSQQNAALWPDLLQDS